MLKNNYRIVQELVHEYQKAIGMGNSEDHNTSENAQDHLRNILDLENSNQHTPLFVAMVKGFLDIAELLAENGLSSLDVKDMAGDTPLHWAVMLGNLKSVQFLLERGVNLEEQNYNKNTPLMIAATNNH